ncbi:efflux RND transporter periplasmic adaptor subunit [Roseobacter sinensis]|uniref:Efflux RND transporter periplasmic adaptor subunit n=1 Tax=Roseobacter sinensis TaxID=2931391 RepID=A0ABT3BEH1_9RHOB|nr:efflux RND transporter periplasmic adaptor subunit [Roseobacter sp. WL0113]MCV3271972.1 efflux RND transporter periplasmic adaptor subunit [Roseobacter sp. WL0113]
MTATATPQKPLWRRILRQGATLVFTLLAIAAAIGLMIFGQSVLAERAADVDAPQATTPLRVTADRLTVEDGYAVARKFPGQIQAAQRTTMAFEQGGTVASLAVDEGDTVEAGALVARLDTRLIEAERTRLLAARRALEAQTELARRTTDRQTELRERGFASNQAVDDVALRLAELEARIAEIDASLVSVAIQLEKSELRAPFDATISTRAVDTGATVGAGQAILSLVETGGQQFRVGLAPDIVSTLSQTDSYEAVFAGRHYPLTLHSVLPELDGATRTRTVLLDFAGDDLPPLRETGTLVLRQSVSERGAWVPLSALQDAPRGLWQLMTLAEDAERLTVGIEAVEVLFSDGARAYVRGTFADGARFIPDGPHRVVAGQAVQLTGEAG